MLPPPPEGDPSAHVVFVNYHRFERASGIHIFHLANALVARGVRCTALVPDDPQSVATFGTPRFNVYGFSDVGAALADAPPPTHVYAWTPRERVRQLTLALAERFACPYLVHLEDDEWGLYDQAMRRRSLWRRLTRGREVRQHLIHPRLTDDFLAGASAVSCITSSLEAFVPAGVPRLTITPGCEPEIFELPYPPSAEARRAAGLAPDETVIVYPGTVHGANVEDMAEIYRAIVMLRGEGRSIRLVRLGRDHVESEAFRLLRDSGCLRIEAEVADRAIPDWLAHSDILVQPGRDTAYNRLRFPSKLPMFLASGRPLITWRFPLALDIIDGRDAVVLPEADDRTIARAIAALADDAYRREAIGRGGRAAARRLFSWETAAARIAALIVRPEPGYMGPPTSSPHSMVPDQTRSL